ncbi:MAG: hypothetical protein O7B98_05255 [Alphaproteobacteria bacterium]|nr:hypothetical protein [Alphaproteobacteria bacterium]
MENLAFSNTEASGDFRDCQFWINLRIRRMIAPAVAATVVALLGVAILWCFAIVIGLPIEVIRWAWGKARRFRQARARSRGA